jgi:hypothetical protein
MTQIGTNIRLVLSRTEYCLMYSRRVGEWKIGNPHRWLVPCAFSTQCYLVRVCYRRSFPRNGKLEVGQRILFALRARSISSRVRYWVMLPLECSDLPPSYRLNSYWRVPADGRTVQRTRRAETETGWFHHLADDRRVISEIASLSRGKIWNIFTGSSLHRMLADISDFKNN